MIAHLRGHVAEKRPHEMILDVNGVGYRLFIPLSTFEKLPDVGQTVHIYTTTHVREDAFHLFGFISVAEKELFGLLNHVNGIGAKIALSALSALSPETLVSAIAQEDIVTLSRVPGIGKKTAQRMIVELRDRLPAFESMVLASSRLERSPGAVPNTLRAELASALINLGFKRPEVDRALNLVLTDAVTDVGQGLRLALKMLSR